MLCYFSCDVSVRDTVNWQHIVVDILFNVASDASAKLGRRRLSSEDMALVVKCVPDEYCRISLLKKHFAKYGVTRVFVNARQHSATVIFRTHVNSIIWSCF